MRIARAAAAVLIAFRHRRAHLIVGDEDSGIRCRLDELLEARGMTLTRLSELVGVSIVNLSVLKNNRARAIRYSTLAAICRARSRS
ncbi:DNA-binding Xre family transcriptional regulator [Frigoribacterium sp. CG_9.8]|nr:DNA-binding Xre family transcriptional regulator [Frigoribacterium sp. CG_9.8]